MISEADRKEAIEIIDRWNCAKQIRYDYEPGWREVRKYVHPNVPEFSGNDSEGSVRTRDVYDGTAIQANIELGNAVHAFIINAQERNFGISVSPERAADFENDDEANDWLEMVSDIIARQYLDPQTGFMTATQEAFTDLAFGTVTLVQEFTKGRLSFRSAPLASVWYEENHEGIPDSVYRVYSYTVRQIKQKFPDAKWDGMDREKDDSKYTVLHCVRPRDENENYGGQEKLPWASYWVLIEKKEILLESGYDSLPIHIGRWLKSNEETYGRGPGINAIADIKMLNRMEFTILKAAMKAVDPPIVVPNDGFISKYKSFPGAVNFKDTSGNTQWDVQVMEHKGNIPIGMEMCDQKREFIRRVFYADWVKLMPKKERQTQYEVMELVEQQLRMMAPMLGRMQAEIFVPCIQRSYRLLNRYGMLPPPPASLARVKLAVDYVTAAARAQAAAQINAYLRYIQNLAILQPIDPSVMDAIDTDFIAGHLATLMGVPRRGLRSPAQISELRKQRAQELAMQAASDAAPKLAKANLDLAKANEAGGLL